MTARATILAVDDSATHLEELASVLRQDGYDVVLAHSGEEALAILAARPVDCVLLDVVMAGLSSQETCRRMKAAPETRDIPLILLTALDDAQVVIDGLAAGADDIAKSSECEILKARIAAQLRRRQFENETRRMHAELHQQEREATEARVARAIAENRATLVAELEQANKELEAFSYSVSHDLRGPLRAVNGFAHILLQDHAPALSAPAQDLIRSVIQGADRMDQLIKDLLRLARLSRQPLNKRPVDMAGLVQEVLGELNRENSGRAVELLVGDLPSAVADRALLKLVFTNLLSNAFKFTRARERAVIEVGSRLEEGGVAYFVRDNGAGFDMRYAGKLFGVFQRLHSQADFEGTGVGLSLAHRIVQRHGGRIRAEAAADKGATFSFVLPA